MTISLQMVKQDLNMEIPGETMQSFDFDQFADSFIGSGSKWVRQDKKSADSPHHVDDHPAAELNVTMDAHKKNTTECETPAVCRACDARHGGVCSTLNPSQLVELNRHSSRREVEAGCEVIGQGEAISSYSNILKGVVKLSKMMSDGRQQIVGLQFAPDFMGRPFQGESTISAEAATNTEICSFPRHMIDKMANEAPDFERKLHSQSLKELDEARDWMLTLGRKTAHEKVASFLNLIATNIDPENNSTTTFDLPLSRADIADFLGLTIETVSRQMTKLRKEGVVVIENNRHVTIPDIRRLRRAAGADQYVRAD